MSRIGGVMGPAYRIGAERISVRSEELRTGITKHIAIRECLIRAHGFDPIHSSAMAMRSLKRSLSESVTKPSVGCRLRPECS